MKKIYATLILSSLIFAVNAQNSRKTSKHATASAANVVKHGNDQVSVLVCDTVTPSAGTDSLLLYTVGSANGGGYVPGNNGYGDLKKATFIPGALVQPASQVTGVFCIFYLNGTNGQGTKGSGAVDFQVYAGDTTTGPTGASLGTNASTMAAIISGGTPIPTNNMLLSLVTFGTPVNAPTAGFFMSMTLPTTTGDTAVLWMTRDMSQTWHSYAWEMWSPSGWYSFVDPNNWDIPGISLTLWPVICYNSTGIHNNALEAGFAMYPIPTSGSLNFAVSLQEATNLNINVVNALGQSVFTATENNTKGGVFNYNLSSLSKGVYFANITDSNNNKIVKKVIIE